MLYGAIAASKTRPAIEGTTLFLGAGNLAASANLLLAPTATFSGIGNLIASGFTINPIQQGSANFIGAGNLAAVTKIILQGSANFVGAGSMRAFNSTVAFSVSLVSDGADSGSNTVSQRSLHTISKGGSFIRVTFKASASGSLPMNHCSVGVQSSTYNTVSTPVELKFNGNSGVTISAGQTVVSDWTQFASSDSDVLIVVADMAAHAYSKYTAAAGSRYYQLSVASYNQASPGGSWSNDTLASAVSQIETG